MTVMIQQLVQLDGPEDWKTWAEKWRTKENVLCNLSFVEDRMDAPGWLRKRRKGIQLDWCATLYEVSKAELLRLIEPRTNYSHISEEMDRPFREAAEKQDALFERLPADGRYAVVWVECS